MSQASPAPLTVTDPTARRSFLALRPAELISLCATVAFAVAVLVHFHDRFWWPPADGSYAHIAERILSGEVLHRDVQDIHTGYVHYLHAWALSTFGVNFTSLRYPLTFLTLVETVLVFGLLLPRGIIIAVAGAAGMVGLSFVQLLNPTANWYALFLTVTVICALAWIPKDNRWRYPAIGFLLATLFLFRQLTGVLVAMGALTYLLGEQASGRPSRHNLGRRSLAIGLLLVMGLGLTWYLITKTSIGATILFGAGPIGLIIWTVCRTNVSNREAATIAAGLAAGAIVATAPLFLYLYAHGAVYSWIEDTFLTAFSLTRLSFFDDTNYAVLLLYTVFKVLVAPDLTTIVNGSFMIILIFLAPVTAALTLLRLRSSDGQTGTGPYLIPILASFHALVAVHYETSVYLNYTVSLSLVGFLWLAAAWSSPLRWAASVQALAMVAVALYFHAGQPITRGWAGIVAGVREPVVSVPELERLGLRIRASDAETYRQLVDLIQRETPVGSAILVLPQGAELYFLSGRRNPTKFYNSAFGIRSDEDLAAVLATLQRDPPRLIFYQPTEWYHTDLVAQVMDRVKENYSPLPSIGGFEIYRLRPDVVVGEGPITP